MTNEDFLQQYPLKVSSAIIAPLGQFHIFSRESTLPLPNLNGMYVLSEAMGIPKSSVRVNLSRMCKSENIKMITDNYGINRYQMTGMMSLISDQAETFGKKEGFTIAVFRFQKDSEKERYRVREILYSFGFQMLAQNVYMSIRVDTAGILQELKNWGLYHNVFLFDCDEIYGEIMEQITAMWKLEEWRKKIDDFYNILLQYWNFDGADEKDIYIRYSIGYSAFFVHFQEKHPAIPFDYLPKDYPLLKVYNLLEQTLKNNETVLINYYSRIHG